MYLDSLILIPELKSEVEKVHEAAKQLCRKVRLS